MFQAILNVLAILVLVLVAGFVIVLLSDLIIGCIDGKRGIIFFKNRKNTDRDNQILLQANKDVELNDSYYLQNNSQSLALEFDKQFEQANQEEVNNNIDLNKALEEEKMIASLNSEKTEEKEPETEINKDFTFINKVSPEKEEELQEETHELPKFEEKEDLDLEDDEEDEDEDKSIEEILKAIRERNLSERNKILQEEMEEDFDEDEDISIIEEIKEDKKEVEELQQAVEESKELENQSKVSEEIEKLNAIIKELNEKIAAEQAKNVEIQQKAEEDIENLKKEMAEKVVAEPTEEEISQEQIDLWEAKLVELTERQKLNDKDLKATKKEYIPLARIERTLENDRNKLRRKEAIVAKRKMVIYGVNNYVVDEEKEQKLQEDIDLLEGLRLSVEHCAEVMEANKDRYPVLKKSYEILTRNAGQINQDIDELKEKIAHAKEVLGSNGGDDSTTAEGTNE